MSSKSISKIQEELDESKIKTNNPINFQRALVSFSQFAGASTTKFIYTGEEKIPFNERHPEYQLIFRYEFADAIRNLRR